MKLFNFALCLFLTTFAFGQMKVQIKVLDEQTGKPLPGIFCTILKDHDQFVNCGNTNEDGVLSFIIRNFEETSSYHMEILNQRQNLVKSGRHEFFPAKQDLSEILVEVTDSSVPNTCSSISYSNYVAKQPYSLDELPVEIVEKLNKVLVEKVGEEFYDRLQLNGGQLVNLDRFFELNPGAKERGNIPYSYSLCFMVTNHNSGEHLYSFNLALDENGNLAKPIELPDIVNFPEKAHIMSLSETTVLAKKMDLLPGRYNSKTLFDSASGSIVHQFELLHHKGFGKYSAEYIIMDAHSATIVRKEWKDIEIISD
ncbi:hypothetical protein [Litoribacter populi]|uniref:hypothetical protein n=1 Tax=Litoribacter populi TaxID=2598460 RepID=UPI00117DC50D|nr:hypothetical protein [Litoribacter populi]